MRAVAVKAFKAELAPPRGSRGSRAEHVREKMIERGDQQHWHWVLQHAGVVDSRVKIREK